MHNETRAQMDAHVDRIVAERAAIGEGRERFIDEARRFTEARLHSGTERDDQAAGMRVARVPDRGAELTAVSLRLRLPAVQARLPRGPTTPVFTR